MHSYPFCLTFALHCPLIDHQTQLLRTVLSGLVPKIFAYTILSQFQLSYHPPTACTSLQSGHCERLGMYVRGVKSYFVGKERIQRCLFSHGKCTPFQKQKKKISPTFPSSLQLLIVANDLPSLSHVHVPYTMLLKQHYFYIMYL